MKPFFRIVFCLIAIFAFFSKQALADDSDSERIESWNSEINISSDSIVEVKETIKYFFPAALQKHGIIRKIPVKYAIKRENGEKIFTINFSLLSVKMANEDGTISDVAYQESSSGKNKEIKIGDANKTVSGPKTYIIDYKVSRVINFSPQENENQDEFYWNVTGTEWDVPIKSAEATVNFPSNIDPEKWQFACYTGPLGAKETECTNEAKSERSVYFASKWPLGAKEGLTIVAGIPKGILTPPKENPVVASAVTFWNQLMPYVFLFLPFGAFVFLFIHWFLRGRDPKGKGTVIPFYTAPAGLSPAEVGTLFDEKADLKDISSSFINFAVKGCIKIKEVPNEGIFGIFKGKNDYELVLLKREETLSLPEKKIFNTLFPPGKKSVRLSELQDVFPAQVENVKDDIYNSLVEKGYFSKSPQKVRNFYFFLGTLIVSLGLVLFFQLDPATSVIGAGSFVITGVMIAVFGLFMPQKTIKGVNAYEQILGLKEYLSVAEKDRLNFHNAPAKKPEIFEKLLPYAMVLGVEKEWAKQFEEIYTSPPQWYEGSNPEVFNTLLLTNALSNFSQVANASMGFKSEGSGAASGFSGFGGGGFSGGGFGGGGGGSW